MIGYKLKKEREKMNKNLRKLWDEYEEVNVNVLRAEARGLGLSAKGPKPELIGRIMWHIIIRDLSR